MTSTAIRPGIADYSPPSNAHASVALGLLEDHLGHCAAQAVAEGGESSAEKVREASAAIARLVRS